MKRSLLIATMVCVACRVFAQEDPAYPREVWMKSGSGPWRLGPNPARMGIYTSGPKEDPKEEQQKKLREQAARAAAVVTHTPEEWRRINEKAAAQAADIAKRKSEAMKSAADALRAERAKLDAQIAELAARRAKLIAEHPESLQNGVVITRRQRLATAQ